MNKLRAGDGSECSICKISNIAYLYMLENTSTFQLKRLDVLIKTPRRFNQNIKAFQLKRRSVFQHV